MYSSFRVAFFRDFGLIWAPEFKFFLILHPFIIKDTISFIDTSWCHICFFGLLMAWSYDRMRTSWWQPHSTEGFFSWLHNWVFTMIWTFFYFFFSRQWAVHYLCSLSLFVIHAGMTFKSQTVEFFCSLFIGYSKLILFFLPTRHTRTEFLDKPVFVPKLINKLWNSRKDQSNYALF